MRPPSGAGTTLLASSARPAASSQPAANRLDDLPAVLVHHFPSTPLACIPL